MIETTTLLHAQAEWPGSLARKTRRRRDSRAIAYHNSRPSPRQSTPDASPVHESPQSNNQFPYQQAVDQQLDLQYLDYFDLQGLSTGNPGYGPIIHQNNQLDSSWYHASQLSYTLAPKSSNSPRMLDGNNASSPVNGFSSQVSNNGQDIPWNESTPKTRHVSSDIDDLSIYDIQVGSIESFDSMLLATPDTGVSSISESYGFPGMDRQFDLPMTSLDGLKLPDSYFQTTEQVFDPSSPGTLSSHDDFSFEPDRRTLSPEWVHPDVYSTQGPQWSSTTLTQSQPTTSCQQDQHSIVPHVPWNSQQAQLSDYQRNANSGVVAFEPSRGRTYDTHRAGEAYLERKQQVFGPPEPVSPVWESENESWIVTSYPSSYAASHNSPRSQGSPASHASPPAQLDSHSHVFSSDSRVSKAKTTNRGRQRNLTVEEKKSAREVRDAKACWACHISKTKCSPCSPGRPCEQCARLVGKRRFCKFTCFNDPLESLHTFLVPHYSMGHFTAANVEAFITNNASSWGSQHLLIRLSWGYRKQIEADVVALALRSSASDMGFHNQAIANGSGRPTLMRKQSPPLGIPLAAMIEMEDAYTRYVRDIVQSDLREYVSIAYDDQESAFSERLLSSVCSLYLHGLEADEENPLLRKAIEMHVTSTIIERSLILDNESIERVQDHMGQEYPPRSAPRCAQRQIKLAFFILQRQRIISVLKEWGNMMWTIHNASNNDKRWATGFSVFIMLTLVMDKTLGSAYYLCENKIAYRGFEADSERAEFRQLVRLTQTELFDRCKEIFHWKFKTRKAGKEACNPIRDGMDAFKGRAVDGGIQRLVWDLRSLSGDFDREIRAHKTLKQEPGSDEGECPYTDAGRLACIFLDDFLEHP